MAVRTARTIKKEDVFLQSLSEGMSVSASCQKASVPRRTVYEWRDRSESFKAAWEAAVEEGTDLLEDEARRRAVQGTEKPVFYQGIQCGSIREYSDTLLIFTLKARRPTKYRDNAPLDIPRSNPLVDLSAMFDRKEREYEEEDAQAGSIN